MADSVFNVIIEKCYFAPYDLAYSREIFYNKLQLYRIVKIIWQLQVKVYLPIALNEMKTSRIHTHTGERFTMYYYSSGENKLGWADTDITSGLEILLEDAVYVLIQSLLLQSTYSFCVFVLEEPKLKQLWDTLHCYLLVLYFWCLFAGSWDACTDCLRLFKFFIC